MQRQDYILRLIEQLGAFFRQVTALRQSKRDDEALLMLVRAQETLLGLPAETFGDWTIEQQFDELIYNETPERAAEKAAAYATLLRATADLYAERDQVALGQGATLLADSVMALSRQHFGTLADDSLNRISALRTKK